MEEQSNNIKFEWECLDKEDFPEEQERNLELSNYLIIAYLFYNLCTVELFLLTKTHYEGTGLFLLFSSMLFLIIGIILCWLDKSKNNLLKDICIGTGVFCIIFWFIFVDNFLVVGYG